MIRQGEPCQAIVGRSRARRMMAIRAGLLFVLAIFTACERQAEDAMLPEVRDEIPVASVWQQARRRGVSFRAIGQEPGWVLEITDGSQILLVTGYGQTRRNMPYLKPAKFLEQQRTRFVLEENEIVIEIHDSPCRDTMSGEEFPVSVRIELGGSKLRGCGRSLH